MAGLQSVTELFERDEPAIGTTLKSVSPTMAEALGTTPLDFLFLDRQHGAPILGADLEHVVRAADIHDLPIVARVPVDDHSMITYLLDTGVAGIMLPQIEDPEFVVEAGSHTRYRHGRSLGTTNRAAEYGAVDRSEYIDHVDQNIALLPQLESADSIERAAEIAQLEETTALAIGPGDLSKTLGVQPGDPEVLDAVDRIFEIGAENDCNVGTFVGTPEGIERYRDDAAFIIYNSDVCLLMDHFDELLGE